MDKADRALTAEALRQAINEESWNARLTLEVDMVKDTPNEAAWCDKAVSNELGKITPEFTAEGFKVTDRRAFEEWCVAHGFGRLVWEVDEQEVMQGCDAAGGLAYFDGEQVPGLAVLSVVPNGISLHPSAKAKDRAKEAIREYLR